MAEENGSPVTRRSENASWGRECPSHQRKTRHGSSSEVTNGDDEEILEELRKSHGVLLGLSFVSRSSQLPPPTPRAFDKSFSSQMSWLQHHFFTAFRLLPHCSEGKLIFTLKLGCLKKTTGYSSFHCPPPPLFKDNIPYLEPTRAFGFQGYTYPGDRERGDTANPREGLYQKVGGARAPRGTKGTSKGPKSGGLLLHMDDSFGNRNERE